MSNPDNYLSESARRRDERRKNLLAELAKLNKEDEDEKKEKERERSRIKELEESQERTARMKENLWIRKREIAKQIKYLKIEDKELDQDNENLTEKLKNISRELIALRKGQKFEYPMFSLKKQKINIERLKEAREKIKNQEKEEEINQIFKILDEEPKNEEPKNEELKNEEPKNEELKNEELKNEELKNEEPKNEELDELDIESRIKESGNEVENEEPKDKLSLIIKFLKESKDEETNKRIELETKEELHNLFDKGVNESNDELREFAYLRIMRFDKRNAFPITENDYVDWLREQELAKKFEN